MDLSVAKTGFFNTKALTIFYTVVGIFLFLYEFNWENWKLFLGQGIHYCSLENYRIIRYWNWLQVNGKTWEWDVQILTSRTNGIDGAPFRFLGFKRGNNVSMKAFPPLLQDWNMPRQNHLLTSQRSNNNLFTIKLFRSIWSYRVNIVIYCTLPHQSI